MKLSSLKYQKGNPRIIKDDRFEKLKKSIEEFPKMLELRPMIYNPETMEVMGGNMRLKALRELEYKDIPNNWIKSAESLTEDEKKRFIIVDNVGFGEWDWDLLADDWDSEELDDWGLGMPITKDDIDSLPTEEMDVGMTKFNDDNCELPITPEFHEKYSYFIVMVKNEIDEAFIRSKFGLDIKHTSHKSTDNRLSNIINFDKLQEACLK